jgi:hypothetical protein
MKQRIPNAIYSKEFREQAVKRVQEEGLSAEAVAKNALRSSLGTRNATSFVPSKNALICARVVSFASSMLITMLRIMTVTELLTAQTHYLVGNTICLQTHFILEEAATRKFS